MGFSLFGAWKALRRFFGILYIVLTVHWRLSSFMDVFALEDRIKTLNIWNKFQREYFSNSSVGDSNALCDFCNEINFTAPGFYRLDPQVISLDVKNPIRPFVEIKENSKQCIFCRKIVKIFNEWSLRQFDKLITPDLRKVTVGYALYTLGAPENSGEWGSLARIMVRLSAQNLSPELPRLLSTAVHFQKCSKHPPTVSELCNKESLFDWESGEEQAYSGRIRPLVADRRLFRKWKETCCATHGDPCSLVFTGSRPAGLRLVDVEKRCVVDSEDDSSYLALSYVWGTSPLPMLTESTDQLFRGAGSLNSETLPSTIDDAIELTKSLGEKYIWIDCLCIMQDDEADKLRFIPQMDSIFGFASVTIVAASAEDANAGLPGIKPGSRTREQIPFFVKGSSFLRTLDPEGPSAWSAGYWPSYLDDSVWYSRGWTFQEKLFSGRALIFTSEQVYWECQKATWVEDGLWETTKSPTLYRRIINEEELRHPWSSDVESFETVYRKLVERYSEKRLTYGSDGLDAFAGILNAFERQAGQTFLWALPAAFLSTALLWPCESFQGTALTWLQKASAKRRPDKCTLRYSDGTSTLCLFPSWSWVGWVGEVRFNTRNGSLNSETVDLMFYIVDGSGAIVQASGSPKTHDTTPSPVFAWKEPESRTIVTPEDIPQIVLTRSIGSNILFFWSSSAELHVEHSGVDEVKKDVYVVSTVNGKVVPGFWSHPPSFSDGHKELAEFVVIGRENFVGGSVEHEAFLHGLALLLISWDSDGVAYRRGLVNIKTSDWVELDNRVWKLISLG